MIIGITGKIGSGKDTVATIVKELYPEMEWQIKGFADKLRQVASLLTGIPAEDMKGQEVKAQEVWEFNMTLRQLLQRLGTNAIRNNLHPNAWVNALMVDYIRIEKTGNDPVFGEYQALKEDVWPNWLVTDTRFPNELNAITDKGGICIRIVRLDNPYPSSNHISETALDGVELLTIINDGNINQLRNRVKEVFDPIVHRLRSGDIGFAQHLPDSA